MRGAIRVGLWALVIVAVMFVCSAHTAVGAVDAPQSIELRTANGAPVRLADFTGKVVLVKFWASWCPQCVESFASLDAIDRDYRSRGVDVLAVNVDERRKDADEFLKKHPYRVRVLFDRRARAFEVFGAS